MDLVHDAGAHVGLVHSLTVAAAHHGFLVAGWHFEAICEAVHAFQKDNKVILEDIRERHAGILQSLKDARPPKPERPELTTEIKAQVEVLKEKQKELHTAREALHENLKDKSKEDREALIADFKKDNKTKHEAIKAQAKVVKKEIRALVETEATRTSDL